METYVLIALISMIFFAINAIVIKSAKDIDPITLTLLSVGTAAILTLLYWVFFNPKNEITLEGAGFGVLSGIVYTVAIVLFIMAIHQGKASVVITINALSAGVAVILAVALLSEKLTVMQIAGIIFGTIAAILLSS